MFKKTFMAFTLLCLTLTAFSVIASPTEAITNEEAAAQNEESVPVNSASEEIEIAIDEYFIKKKVVPGMIGKGGKIYYSAIQTVDASSASPDWAKSRVLAFEKALLKAQTEYIKNTFGRNSLETVNKHSEDQSSNKDKFQEDPANTSEVVALYDKVVALGGAKLDSLLIDAGVEPEQYDALPPEKRKTLYMSSFIKKSLVNAMGKSSGLLPVQTFEGSDGNGKHAIGVVMVRSEKLQQLASDMSSQREPFLKISKGKPIVNYINLPAKSLAGTFGVRVVFNEQGQPVVLSYGQWGFGYSGTNDKRLDRNREHSAKKADTMAMDGLTVFMNSNIAFQSKNETGEVIENVLIKRGDEITEEDISVIVDKTVENAKLKASAKISGTNVIKRWKYKHPYGHEIIGRVRMWSMEGVNSAKSASSFRPNTTARRNNSEVQAKNKHRQESGVSMGVSFDEEEEAF